MLRSPDFSAIRVTNLRRARRHVVAGGSGRGRKLPIGTFRGLCEMKSTGRLYCGAAGNSLSYITVAHDKAAPAFSIITTAMFAG